MTSDPSSVYLFRFFSLSPYAEKQKNSLIIFKKKVWFTKINNVWSSFSKKLFSFVREYRTDSKKTDIREKSLDSYYHKNDVQSTFTNKLLHYLEKVNIY